MKRRKFLLGTGALAASGAAAMGSGAFSVYLRDRNATGTIESDDDAYLQLEANNPYSSINSGSGDDELDVTLNRLNSNSVTELDDIFYIRNDGQEAVGVTIQNISNFPQDVNILDVYVSSKSGAGGATVGASLIGNREPVPVGGQLGIGVEVEVTQNLPSGQSASGTFDIDAA